jgi:hypothetical protein
MPKHAKTNAAKTTSFVKRANGSPPEGEEQQEPGFLGRAYRQFIPADARIYLETLFGKRDPVTAKDFTPQELARIEDAIRTSRVYRTEEHQSAVDLAESMLKHLDRVDRGRKQGVKELLRDPEWKRSGKLWAIKDPTDEQRQQMSDSWKKIHRRHAENLGFGEDIMTLLGETDPKKLQSYFDERYQRYAGEGQIQKVANDLEKYSRLIENIKNQEVPRGDVQYEHYRTPEDKRPTIERTLGRFTYTTLPDGRRVVTDNYDFYNEARSKSVNEYEKMSPSQRALEVIRRSATRGTGLVNELGNAYIGRDGRPVRIEYDPAQVLPGDINELPPGERIRALPPDTPKAFFANGGAASKSGVNRLKQSEAYPKMPRFQDGGDVSNDEFIQQMMVGTLPVDQESPADARASKMLRALSEGTRGALGLDAIEPGSEAYRTGQALSNMPGVGIAVGTAKGVGKAGGKLSELEKRLLRSQGTEGAKRVQRAADEIKNLEDQFSLDALELAFQGRKGSPYQGVMTMKPADFEKYAARLDERAPSLNRRVEDLQWVLRDASDKNLSESRRALMGFSDVPYLRADVEPERLARITGHEGRHRTRAMTAENMPTTLVELLPQSGLEFRGQLPMPGTSPSQWRDEVNKLFSRGVVAEKEKRLAPEVAELMFQQLQLERGSSPDWDKIRRIEEELDLWRQSGKYFLEDPTVVRQMPEVYADGGDVSNDDWIQQTMTGTRPADQDYVTKQEFNRLANLLGGMNKYD